MLTPIRWRVSTIRRRSVTADNWGVPDRNEAGDAICRWCRVVVRPPRRTFCSDACVHEWKLRSSPSYVRQKVWKRDRGICRLCCLNVGRAERMWKRQRPRTTDRKARRAWRASRPRWEADHIVAVADGGGECGLENYRLLCQTCHRMVTAQWRKERRQTPVVSSPSSAPSDNRQPPTDNLVRQFKSRGRTVRPNPFPSAASPTPPSGG